MFLLPVSNGNSFSGSQDADTGSERECPFIANLLSSLPRN